MMMIGKQQFDQLLFFMSKRETVQEDKSGFSFPFLQDRIKTENLHITNERMK